MKPWGQLAVFLPGKPLDVLNLFDDSYTIGRGAESKYPLEGPQYGNLPCLRDTSFNGTLVDGKQVPLSHRSEIEVRWDLFFIFYNVSENSEFDLDRDPSIMKNRFYILENHQLGQGTFARVVLAIDILFGDRLACKVIDKKNIRLKSVKQGGIDLTQVDQEISILKCLSHPNIVHIIDVVQTQDFVYIFLTRVMGGELFNFIVDQDGIKEHEAKFLFYQILRGVKYLHDRNITHRDLKPENLLLEAPNAFSRVFITDFGMAKMLDTSLERMKTRCGTLDYLAPEVIENRSPNGYSQKVDIWSLGVMLFAMLSGFLPFEHQSKMNNSVPTTSNQPKFAVEFLHSQGWVNISADAKDLIRSMLNVDPQKRTSVNEVLEHPWIVSQKTTLAKLYSKILVKSGVVVLER